MHSARVMSSIIIDDTQRERRKEKKITNGFMSTNISIENRWVKRQQHTEMFMHSTLEHRLWLYASIDKQRRWTTMWKLLENNKLNFVRVQCGATNQEHELQIHTERWRENEKKSAIALTNFCHDNWSHIPLYIHGIPHYLLLAISKKKVQYLVFA